MLCYTALAFNELMTGLLTLYTPVQIARELSLYDELALHLVVAEARGTGPILYVTFEHSADGRIWSEVTGAGSFKLPLDLSRPSSAVGYVLARTPRLRFTRFKVRLDDSSQEIPTVARVRLYVAARDTAKREPCPCEDRQPSNGLHHRVPPESDIPETPDMEEGEGEEHDQEGEDALGPDTTDEEEEAAPEAEPSSESEGRAGDVARETEGVSAEDTQP